MPLAIPPGGAQYRGKLFLEDPTAGKYQGIVSCPLSTQMTNEALQLLTHQHQWATCLPRRPGGNPRTLNWALQNMSHLSILEVKTGHTKQVLKMALREEDLSALSENELAW